MIYHLILLIIILALLLFAIWRQKRLTILKISIYEEVTKQLSTDYIKKLSEVEGKILREIADNQKVQEDLAKLIKVISDGLNSVRKEQEKNMKTITDKLDRVDKQILEMSKQLEKIKK